MVESFRAIFSHGISDKNAWLMSFSLISFIHSAQTACFLAVTFWESLISAKYRDVSLHSFFCSMCAFSWKEYSICSGVMSDFELVSLSLLGKKDVKGTGEIERFILAAFSTGAIGLAPGLYDHGCILRCALDKKGHYNIFYR